MASSAQPIEPPSEVMAAGATAGERYPDMSSIDS